jgi:regulatory protein
MLARKLAQAGYAEPAVAAALDRAAAERYLDDEAFARALVRRRSSGRGRAVIARELRARGIEAEKAGEALDELDPDSELDRARQLARAMIRAQPPRDREQLRATVGGRLGRRGFSAGVITRILRELAAEGARAPLEEEGLRFDTPLEPD